MHEDERSVGREVISKTQKYYEKVKRSIVTSIMPSHFEHSKSKGDLRVVKKASEGPTFQPEINLRSKNMKRSGSVGDILYEDAVKRERDLAIKQK